MNESNVNISNSSPKCILFDDDEQWKCDVIIGIRRTSAALSLIGCAFMIAAIWLFRKYQFLAQRLVLQLSIAGFFASIAYLMGGTYLDGPLCNFEGFCLTFFEWTILMWVCCITLNIFTNAILMKKTDHCMYVYYIIGWVIPFVIGLIPVGPDVYGPSGAWCWILPEYPKWRFGIWYGPLFIIITILFITFIVITVIIRRRIRRWEGMYSPELERAKQILKEDVAPLSGYPFVYLVTSIMPIINRINNLNQNEPVFALYILHALFAPLSGVLNSIVFGLDRDMRSRLTWVQIKAFFLSRLHPQPIIKEVEIYPEGYESMTENQ